MSYQLVGWLSSYNISNSVAIADYVFLFNSLAPETYGNVIAEHNVIEAETKLPPFRRQHIQMHFYDANIWISLQLSLKFVPKVQINYNPSLVQNGLAPTRRQAIIWTSGG